MRHLLALLALASVAHAEQRSAADLYRTASNASDASARVDAAEHLAIRFQRDADARGFALTAVLTDDRAIRAPLIAAIVDAGVWTRDAAAHAPTLLTVERAISTLKLREVRGSSCTVTPDDPHRIVVTCSVVHDCTTYEARLEVWPHVRRIAETAHDLGKCGCVCCTKPPPRDY